MRIRSTITAGAKASRASGRKILAHAKPPLRRHHGHEGQRTGVQSLGRAFAILEEVARDRHGIGLAELSKRLGLHSSTTFHLAKTLVSLGYIRQEPGSKRYRIGGPLFALAASALDEIEMVNLAKPVLQELSQRTGESSHFSVLMGDSVVVIARTGSPGAFQLADRVGVLRPAHCTALGKVMLASLSDDQFARFLQRAELDAFTQRSITEPAALRREIAAVRRTGLAIDDGEFNSEVRCLAVPVHDFTGQVVGAVGISGPIWRDVNKAQKTKILHAAAQRLSESFGAVSTTTKRGKSNEARQQDPNRRRAAAGR